MRTMMLGDKKQLGTSVKVMPRWAIACGVVRAPINKTFWRSGSGLGAVGFGQWPGALPAPALVKGGPGSQEPRATLLVLLGALSLLVAAPGLSGADSALPLPQGVAGTRGPTPLRMGASLLQIESFATAMDKREVRTFYRRALPSAGWRMDLLPWQASHVAAMQRVEETLQRSPNAPEAPAPRARP